MDFIAKFTDDIKKLIVDKLCNLQKTDTNLQNTDQVGKMLANATISSIVINANPFTYGHEHLARRASLESDLLVVFVVRENKSQFSYETCFEAVE